MKKHDNQKSLCINYQETYQCKECSMWFRLKATLINHKGHCKGYPSKSTPMPKEWAINKPRASGRVLK
jgi:hypothetical protein